MHCAVNIRGTSGSGKSTVARRVMEALEARGHHNHQQLAVMGGRERIVGHLVGNVFFAGKYATDCGGCDAMSWKGAADDICEMVYHRVQLGPVVMEGLMLSSWGNGRLRDLWERCERKLHVLQLTTSLEECLAAVNARRAGAWRAKGKEGLPPPLNPENTTSKYRSAERDAILMREGGMNTVEFLDRESAYLRALELVK